MKVFIDFEATEQGEIIAVGAKTTDKEFYSLVRPQFSELTPIIKNLTHITKEELEQASSLNYVLGDLFNWCKAQDREIYQWEFYSYGNADIHFLKKSLRNCYSDIAYGFICVLIATIQDVSVDTKKFFKQNVKLQHVYNYIKDKELTQKHNALEDARMLRDVVQYMDNNKAFEISPFIEIYKTEDKKKKTTSLPKGQYMALYEDGRVAHLFADMETTVKWLLSKKQFVNMPKDSRPRPIRIANKIAKAANEGTIYCGYNWRKMLNEKSHKTN